MHLYILVLLKCVAVSAEYTRLKEIHRFQSHNIPFVPSPREGDPLAWKPSIFPFTKQNLRNFVNHITFSKNFKVNPKLNDVNIDTKIEKGKLLYSETLTRSRPVHYENNLQPSQSRQYIIVKRPQDTKRKVFSKKPYASKVEVFFKKLRRKELDRKSKEIFEDNVHDASNLILTKWHPPYVNNAKKRTRVKKPLRLLTPPLQIKLKNRKHKNIKVRTRMSGCPRLFRPLDLYCSHNASSNAEISWWKKNFMFGNIGDHLIAVNNNTHYSDPRYSVEHRNSESTLRINTFHISDSASYECRVKNYDSKGLARLALLMCF